ncbi:MAG: hypothetical protein WA004_06645 [Saprospiraceae bacterium]
MTRLNGYTAEKANLADNPQTALPKEPGLDYRFENFFHPYAEEFLKLFNKNSEKGLFDANKLKDLEEDFFKKTYDPQTGGSIRKVEYQKKTIDWSVGGSFSVYNWELFFHVPLSIAVHLSKNQRFAEAQKWFHFIFDPTSTDDAGEPSLQCWKFLYFRQHLPEDQIEDLLLLLCQDEEDWPEEEKEINKQKKADILNGYEAILRKPFMPHAVARTRFTAYQMQVVMKYLDNLIAWGDSLFRQDSIETINEATQLYVMAANILGPRPQKYPPAGKRKPLRYLDLKENPGEGLSNTLVNMENQFPFLAFEGAEESSTAGEGEALLGISRVPYFCLPRNDKLLSYWDNVADRLFKIRHCMNIEGVVRQLPLFEPPIDPGLLVRAAAAGIDISSLVSGLNQPVSPLRALPLIHQAQELAKEVKTLGKDLLEIIEKRDREKLALLKTGHEIRIRQLLQEVRFLEWKKEEENTETLLRSRSVEYESYRYYQLQLGKKEQDLKVPKELSIERKEISEENFEELYEELIGQYAQDFPLESYPIPPQEGDSNPKNQSGGSGKGLLNLIRNEAKELGEHFPEILKNLEKIGGEAENFDRKAWIPEFTVSKAPQGIGETTKIAGAKFFYQIARKVMDKYRSMAFLREHKAKAAARTAEMERRGQDWSLQANIAAAKMMEIGRRILASLLREQIARHGFESQKELIGQAEEVDNFLRGKFSNEELYGWMQGELSKLYYEYYKLAFDLASKAERTMKHELLRPELDERYFIQFNYWDGGRKGLLSGEALYLDLKRLELAYHDYNKREYEIVKHITLSSDSSSNWAAQAGVIIDNCEIIDNSVKEIKFTLEESLFDLDFPGHYMRRIKHACLSLENEGQNAENISCTLTLLESSIRKSPLVNEKYIRSESEDDPRFIDYFGPVQSIATSHGQYDGGLFNLDWKDERFLPFEGAGAKSSWRITFPQNSGIQISQITLHLYFTAREGGEILKDAAEAALTSPD